MAHFLNSSVRNPEIEELNKGKFFFYFLGIYLREHISQSIFISRSAPVRFVKEKINLDKRDSPGVPFSCQLSILSIKKTRICFFPYLEFSVQVHASVLFELTKKIDLIAMVML